MQSQISVENRYSYLPPLNTSAEPTNYPRSARMQNNNHKLLWIKLLASAANLKYLDFAEKIQVHGQASALTMRY